MFASIIMLLKNYTVTCFSNLMFKYMFALIASLLIKILIIFYFLIHFMRHSNAEENLDRKIFNLATLGTIILYQEHHEQLQLLKKESLVLNGG